MSRHICVYQDFLDYALQAKIQKTAEKAGFIPHFFTPQERSAAEECLKTCEILYTCTPSLLPAASSSLKWCCAASAGVDAYCKNEALFPSPGCLLSNTNCYGVTIAEHIVMVTLMLFRRMPEYQEMIRNRGWGDLLSIRSIRDSAFTLLGTGNIGVNAAQRLRGMNAGVLTGVSRSGRPHPAFDRVIPMAQLEEILPETHVLIMSLPDTAETRRVLNRDRIALLPPDALVINVGRGAAIDQEALANALNRGELAGAALDVTDPEPLPQDHPLWTAKNLILTPHASGNLTLGYTRDLNVEMFCQDLVRYAAGEPLQGLVDRSRGY